MLSLQQLNDWLKDAGQIILDINTSVYNMNRIQHPVNDAEKEIMESPFFQHYRKQLMHIVVIELCKLFLNSDIERRNFRKLFHRMKLEPYDTALKNRLKQNRKDSGLIGYKKDAVAMLTPFIDELDKRKELVYRIKGLRDRAYAHKDPGQNLPEVRLEEMEDLAKLAAAICQEISTRILGTDPELKAPDEMKLDHVIQSLIH